jgi:toxin YoeB
MKLVWSSEAWEDYLYWLRTDQKVTSSINELIKDIRREPFKGLGKPEPLNMTSEVGGREE